MEKHNGKPNGRGAVPLLEMHVSRGVHGTGRNLSGVVVFRISKPTGIRSLTVSLTGRETPLGASLTRALRDRGPFFHREILLSGREEPRFTSERMSRFWREFLGRETGRNLSAGEHMYPFSIPLPSPLPPSYEGEAGKIDYQIAARVRYLLGRSAQVSTEVPVALVPRARTGQPVVLHYPAGNGAAEADAVSVDVELPGLVAERGKAIAGRFAVLNPGGAEIGEARVSLEMCESVRGTSARGVRCHEVDSRVFTPDNPNAAAIEGDFHLTVPEDAPPTVEGTAISVLWFLKLNLDTDPAVEIKTPITVYTPS